MDIWSVFIAAGALTFTVLVAAIGWFGGIRVLKYQVQQLQRSVETMAAQQDSTMAVRVDKIEKWIEDTGSAEQVRAWGHIREVVPKLQERYEELGRRVTQLETTERKREK